jgi:UPF0716 protein FxsA
MKVVRIPGWLLLVAFVVVPLVEIFVLVQVGQVIGPWWTILLLIAASALGAWLIKREGSRAWAALREALQTGRMPARELADAGLILIGGTLMLTPGFVSDVVGILLILPLTRPVARRLLTRMVAARLVGPAAGPLGGQFGGPFGSSGPQGPRDARRPGPDPQGPVVRGEVVDDE